MKLSRLYATAKDAEAAAGALIEAGFRAGDFEIVTADAKGWISKETLMGKEVSKTNAAAYAEALRAGRILLLVNPLLGYAEAAEKVLAAPRGTENATATVGFEGTTWDEATPISSALFLPVLSKNPTPFGTFWNVPTLLKNYWFFSDIFGGKLLSRKPSPLSDSLGWKTLLTDPAPFSSLLKMKVLTKG